MESAPNLTNEQQLLCLKLKPRLRRIFGDSPVQVALIMKKADKDGNALIDLEEFLHFVRIMRTGDPHQGPITSQVGMDLGIIHVVIMHLYFSNCRTSCAVSIRAFYRLAFCKPVFDSLIGHYVTDWCISYWSLCYRFVYLILITLNPRLWCCVGQGITDATRTYWCLNGDKTP